MSKWEKLKLDSMTALRACAKASGSILKVILKALLLLVIVAFMAMLVGALGFLFMVVGFFLSGLTASHGVIPFALFSGFFVFFLTAVPVRHSATFSRAEHACMSVLYGCFFVGFVVALATSPIPVLLTFKLFLVSAAALCLGLAVRDRVTEYLDCRWNWT